MRISELVVERGKNYFFIMHQTYGGECGEELWTYSSQNNVIGLDYPEIVKDNWLVVRDAVKNQLPHIWVKQLDMFCDESKPDSMKVRDIVLILEGWSHLLGVAELRGKYQYNRGLSESETFFDHIRQVQWRRKHPYSQRQRLPKPIKGFVNTLFRVERKSNRWSLLSDLEV